MSTTLTASETCGQTGKGERHVTSSALRHLRGRSVEVDSNRGSIHGVLVSTTLRSLWLLVGDDDLILSVESVTAVRAA